MLYALVHYGANQEPYDYGTVFEILETDFIFTGKKLQIKHSFSNFRPSPPKTSDVSQNVQDFLDSLPPQYNSFWISYEKNDFRITIQQRILVSVIFELF